MSDVSRLRYREVVKRAAEGLADQYIQRERGNSRRGKKASEQPGTPYVGRCCPQDLSCRAEIEQRSAENQRQLDRDGRSGHSPQTVASVSAQSGTDGAFAFTPAANPKCPATTVLVAPRPGPRQSRIQHADHGDEQNTPTVKPIGDPKLRV